MTADTRAESPFATIEEAIEDVRAGRIRGRRRRRGPRERGRPEIAAQFATPEAVNFMVTYGRGLVCRA